MGAYCQCQLISHLRPLLHCRFCRHSNGLHNGIGGNGHRGRHIPCRQIFHLPPHSIAGKGIGLLPPLAADGRGFLHGIGIAQFVLAGKLHLFLRLQRTGGIKGEHRTDTVDAALANHAVLVQCQRHIGHLRVCRTGKIRRGIHAFGNTAHHSKAGFHLLRRRFDHRFLQFYLRVLHGLLYLVACAATEQQHQQRDP